MISLINLCKRGKRDNSQKKISFRKLSKIYKWSKNKEEFNKDRGIKMIEVYNKNNTKKKKLIIITIRIKIKIT